MNKIKIYKQSKKGSTSGFSLVQLAITIAIIGLLIVGTLGGLAIYDAAKISAQAQQFKDFDKDLSSFYERFNCIPGDCTTNFDNDGNPTYVGNGDGLIGTAPQNASWIEGYKFFIHLSHGLDSKRKYIHIPSVYKIDSQYPKLKMNNGGFTVVGNKLGEVFYITISSSGSAGIDGLSNEGVFSPTQAHELDTMMDDGNPLTGNVVAVTNAVNATNGGVPYPMTLTSNSPNGCVNSSKYNTSLKATNLCRLLIKAKFRN